jgi:deaminated glutathione amidase
LFLPEASDFVAEKEQAKDLAQSIDGDFIQRIRTECQRNSIHVSIGVHEQVGAKTFNSNVMIDSNGNIAGIYRKLHLFDVSVPNGPILMESSSTEPGQLWVPPITTSFGRVGLGICYDVRFPEFSTLLQKQGVDIITYPSAFTIKTGKAHWEVLLRARAIETQSFVIAAAQFGKHTRNRESYGHAMIVDPWGEVLVECSPQEPLRFAEIDLVLLQDIRAKMPVLTHRRNDIYDLSLTYK